jgi:reverse gyrase
VRKRLEKKMVKCAKTVEVLKKKGIRIMLFYQICNFDIQKINKYMRAVMDDDDCENAYLLLIRRLEINMTSNFHPGTQ